MITRTYQAGITESGVAIGLAIASEVKVRRPAKTSEGRILIMLCDEMNVDKKQRRVSKIVKLASKRSVVD